MGLGRIMKSRLAALTLIGLLAADIVAAQSPRISANDQVKLDGAIRVGLVTPRVTLIGGGGMVAQETNLLRQNLISYLTGPRIGAIDLKAKLDSLALEEGKERQCEYVLYTSLVRKRQTAAGGAGGSYATGTRAGDEFTFEYKIVASDGSQPPVGTVLKARVNSDGEDVLTRMVEAAAQAVVNLAKARPAPTPAPAPATTPLPSPLPVGSSHNSEPVQPEARPTPMPTPAPSVGTGYGSLTATPPRTGTSGSTTRVNDPPKTEGAIRIGLATPRTSTIGGGMAASNEAASLRQLISSFLQGSIIETIDLKARLDSLAVTEGQKRECDYILYTSVVRKRTVHSSSGSSPLGSIMGGMPGGMSPKIPGGKAVKDVTSGAAKVSSTIAALSKANDEITFEYKLVTIEGARPVLAKLSKAKVKNDGEDVLTPMIESAAQSIVDLTTKN